MFYGKLVGVGRGKVLVKVKREKEAVATSHMSFILKIAFSLSCKNIYFVF